MTKFGEALKEARGTRVSQQQLQAAISQYESGSVIPRPEKVVAIAAELGLPPDDLLAATGYYRPRRPEADEGAGATRLTPEDEEQVRDTARVLAGLVYRLAAPRLWPRVLAELQVALQSMTARKRHGLGGTGQEWLRDDDQWQQDELKATRELDSNTFEGYSTPQGVLSRLKN
jgi:transcriptional regulator with XRE-family HTH domain